MLQPINERFARLEQYQEDKSFNIRLLMIQKSQILFEENPLFGAGLGQFTKSNVDLQLPDELDYATTDYFNVPCIA